MRIIRDTNSIFSRIVSRAGSGSGTATGSLVVVLIISICVLLVGIIS